jgi:hypothetical protein
MLHHPIAPRTLFVLACAGALAASLIAAPASGAHPAADPSTLVGSWQRVLTQPDIDRTASFREEPPGWDLPLAGPQKLVIADGSFTFFDKTGFSVAQTTRIDSSGAFDPLTYIAPDKGAFCPQDIPQNASYTWALDGSDLILTPTADPCADRNSILAGRWTLAPKTRTLLARETSSKESKTGYAWADRLTEGGKPVGTDSGSCRFTGKSPKRATCKTTLRLTNGTIAMRGTVDASQVFRLTIVSGTGAYEGARGSGTAKPAGKSKSLIALHFA